MLFSRPPRPICCSMTGIMRSSAARRVMAGSMCAKEAAVHIGQDVGIVICRAAEHHAIDVAQVLVARIEALDATVDDDGEIRARGLKAIDALVIERRNLAVLFRRQAFQPGLAGMHDERSAAGFRHAIDEALEISLRVLVVDADAALHGDRNGHGVRHRCEAQGDEIGFRHQAGAEAAFLHAIGGAADVEIDLTVAEFGADARGFSQFGRIGPAQLQSHGLFGGIEPQEPFAIAVQDRFRCHHLRIEQGMPRQPAMEGPAMPVCPIHHGGNAEGMRGGAHGAW